MRSYKKRIGPADRPAMNPPTRGRAQEISQQTTAPDHFTTHPSLERADARYFTTSMPEFRPRVARQARTLTKKRPLDDSGGEAKAEEPLQKRPREKAAAQEEEGVTAHERVAFGKRRREDDADNHAKTEKYSRKGRKLYQHSTSGDLFRHQERSNLSMDVDEATQDGTAEAKQRGTGASVEISSIAPVNMTTRSSVTLQASDSSRSSLGTPKKKVRFEDEIPGKVPEELASLSSRFHETQERMLGAGPQLRSSIQREDLDQPTDVDVVMVDVGEALSALSFLHMH